MAKGKNKIRDLQFWYPNIPRKLVMAKGLSIQAKFIYMYMSCQSETFDFYLEPMAKEMNIGTRTLTKYIDELVGAGWITKGGQKFKNGRLGAVDYIVETSPKKKNTDVQKTAYSNTDVSNCADKYINSSINTPLNEDNSTMNSPVINKEEKRLSNDNQKVPDDLFEKFWEAYGNKKSKEPAMKAWKRLTKEEKEAAIKRIPEYKEDCRLHERQMKYPATYLNQKTWEDDFDCDGRVKAEEYKTEDEDRKLWEKQKEWLQKKLPNIAPEITQGVMKEFTNLAICDKHLLQETLEELNKVYDGGDIVERFKEILNR